MKRLNNMDTYSGFDWLIIAFVCKDSFIFARRYMAVAIP